MDYELWLKRKSISRNSISFYMRTLRSIYNKAVDASLIKQCNPFDKVYTGIDRTPKRAVCEDVILRLMKLNLAHSKPLFYARDLFIFSFYTRGMAFVDMWKIHSNWSPLFTVI